MAIRQSKSEVLTALDVAKTQYYHFTAIIIAGMGFFTDAYDLFCISAVTKLLGRLYYTHAGSGKVGVLPASVYSAVSGVALVGALVGQLFFGWLGDKLGRKKVYGLTLLMMIVFSFASALSFGTTAKAVMTTLCFFRFIRSSSTFLSFYVLFAAFVLDGSRDVMLYVWIDKEL